MKYTIVTTFNDKGYNTYGQRMIDTFVQNWPSQVQLIVYAEDLKIASPAPNVQIKNLHKSSPEIVAFKTLWANDPRGTGNVESLMAGKRKDAKKAFKWDAIRFSHKVYSIFHAAKNCNSEWLIWMDGDMVCHSPITMEKLSEFFPDDRDLCFAGRSNKYTECGLYGMHLTSPEIQNFLTEFQRMYDDAENGIYLLKEWHDSYVFDDVRARTPLKELNWSNNIIDGEGHPLINCEWGAYIDHLKGARKELGRSKSKDLLVKRNEAYWQ